MAAIHNAIETSNLPLLNQLIAEGADLNEQDEEGMTAFNIACRDGNLDLIVRLLEEQNIDLNLGNHDGMIPIYNYILHGNAFIDELDYISEEEVEEAPSYLQILRNLVNDNRIDLIPTQENNHDNQSEQPLVNQEFRINEVLTSLSESGFRDQMSQILEVAIVSRYPDVQVSLQNTNSGANSSEIEESENSVNSPSDYSDLEINFGDQSENSFPETNTDEGQSPQSSPKSPNISGHNKKRRL